MADAPASVTDPRPPVADHGVGGGVLSGDWPARAADTVERVVDSVRSKTTGPAIVVSRAIVYGFVGAVLATVALVLFLAALIRALDVYLPRGIWLPYLILGGLLGLSGALLWRKRRPATP
jgi:hypothetical protein